LIPATLHPCLHCRSRNLPSTVSFFRLQPLRPEEAVDGIESHIHHLGCFTRADVCLQLHPLVLHWGWLPSLETLALLRPTTSGNVITDKTSVISYFRYRAVNIQNIFLFWPIRVAGVSEGWAYGTYSSLQSLTHRELLEKGRLSRGHREKGLISEAQVEASFRHHEALAVALETNRVLLETFQIDEQQFTEPVAIVSEERAKEALLEFLRLKDRDAAVAVAYMNEFGEFDHLEMDEDRFVGDGIPESIHKLCKEYARKRQDTYAVSLSHFWAVRDEIKGLWNLAIALDQKDPRTAKGECLNRRPNSTFDPDTNWLAVGKAILCADVSASLNPGKRNPRLILSERDGAIVALTMATTVRTGLYLTLFDMIASKTEYRKCLNCEGLFIPNVQKQQYCKQVCQNAAKIRRYRDRHKGGLPAV
jgi:hypothetical protein